MYYASLSEAERAAIESVSMDMWPAYINATLGAPAETRSKIAFDKFHVAKYLGEAVDKVRRAEHKALRESTLKTARAWALKEVAMSLWDYVRRTWARKGWARWLAWAVRSRLEPIKKVAKDHQDASVGHPQCHHSQGLQWRR